MDQDLLLIKEFSKLTGLSRKALYLYDHHQLLQPAWINPDNAYRYYGQNQLLTAKRIHLLKEAGFSLKEIKDILRERLTEQDIHRLTAAKLDQEAEKIKTAHQAISQLENLRQSIEAPADTAISAFIEPLTVYEYHLAPETNICIALHNAEQILNTHQLTAHGKIIKYDLKEGAPVPVSIAFTLEERETASLPLEKTSFFGALCTQIYAEVDPYAEESASKIREILSPSLMPKDFVYERILNEDDYLYSSKRLSVFIFEQSL